MTTLSQAREAIYQRFVDVWADETIFTLDNESFEPPGTEPWVRVSVRHSASTQSTLGGLGNRKFTRFGSAFIQIFVLGDKGTTESDQLSTKANNAFEGISLVGTTVRFLDVIVREAGPDGKWYQVVVEAAFEYEEIR